MNADDKDKNIIKGKFFVAGNAFIFKWDEILITKRSSNRDHDPDKWECVSWRFNQNLESVEIEMLREIKEELWTNFECSIIAPISFYHLYRSGKKENELVWINFICKYISWKIHLSNEHTESKWVNPLETQEIDMDEQLKENIKYLLKIKDFYLNDKLFINL
ncbi:MAG: hypothetical protein ACD_4C00171G0001 [uncultured bacterium (gcode 4)]|uniref:Nudix hydrolase domain-containing protein n=1 Tax=uncultured bacterium (gcode 4) TaxID=1234023 RepID=K2FXW3_9BACT|nr:MAG: hypothetical protein ACD_4C00171G0001 [uncultured bacterium (gcode 4)]